MSRKIEVVISGDADSLSKAFGKAQTSGEKFKKGLDKVSKFAVGALGGLAAGAVVAVKAASDLGEQVSKTGVVFGDSAKEVHAWSKTTASSMGISQRAALEASGTFGNMLVPMGLARGKAAEMSTTFVGLAADMASFNNASPEETLDALRAGLAGETEPLRRFGVFLDAARIQQEALNLGLVKGKEKLTAAAKAQATYSIIMKDTADTQGDFARTSGGLANQQRILKARFEDVSAQLGRSLLPLATQLGGLLQRLTTFTSEHSGAVKIGAVALASLAGSILLVNAGVKAYTAAQAIARAATVAWTAVQWLLNVALTANPIGIVIVAIAGLAAGIIIAWKKSETFRTIVTGVFSAVRDAVLSFAGIYLTVVSKFLGGLASIAEGASKLPLIGDKFRGVAEAVRGAQAKVDGLRGSISALKSKEVTVTTNIVTRRFESITRVEDIRGRRAHGGPVTAGDAFLVGERGPEIFTPNRSGQIIPRVPPVMAGGRRGIFEGGNKTIKIELHGHSKPMDEAEVGRQVQRALRHLELLYPGSAGGSN